MSHGPNPILDSSNNFTTATTAMSSNALNQLAAVPLGKTAGGEVAQKVIPLGSSSTTSGATTVSDRQYATVSTAAPVTANGDAFTLAAGEIGFVQNLDTEALFVKLGTGASAASFNFVLKAGTATDDGNGGSVLINNWVGVVSIFATATARASAWKLS